MTTEKLIEKAREYHAAAMAAITAAGNGADGHKTRITNFINAGFAFGKYHGIMEILEQLDFDAWIKLAEELQEDCHKFLEGMDALYYLN